MSRPHQIRRRGAVPELRRGGDDGHEAAGGLGRIRMDDAVPRRAPRVARYVGGGYRGRDGAGEAEDDKLRRTEAGIW